MTQHIITTEAMAAFRRYLMAAERRPATIVKYLREVQAFTQTLPPGGPVTKETVLAWKRTLVQTHAPSTVNGKLAALNTFFAFLGWGECRVKALRRQRELFRDPGRELHKGDYLRLLAAARKDGQLAALLPHGDPGLHRGAGVGAAVCHRPGPAHRAGLGGGEGERAAWSSSPPSCAGCWPSTAGSGALLPGRCSSPGRGGPWTGPTSGGSCDPLCQRRGWRPSGSFPTTSATSSPGRFMLWRRTLQSWRTSWATPAWRRRESISWRAARSTRARWSDWAWSSDTQNSDFVVTSFEMVLRKYEAQDITLIFYHILAQTPGEIKENLVRRHRKPLQWHGKLGKGYENLLERALPRSPACFPALFLRFLGGEQGDGIPFRSRRGFPSIQATTKSEFCGSPNRGTACVRKGVNQCEKAWRTTAPASSGRTCWPSGTGRATPR